MPDDLDLEAVIGSIHRPDQPEPRGPHEETDPRPPMHGRLDELAGWLTGVQGTGEARALDRVRLLMLAGDDGVSDFHVSDLAASLRVSVRVAALPADGEAGMSRAETEAALRAGIALADEEADAGTDLLVVAAVGQGAAVPAAALVGLLTRSDPSMVTSRGGRIDDALWMRRCAAVRDTMRRGRPVLGDYVELLATVGSADLAATTGVLLQSAARRTPVLLDGVITAAAALVAQRIAFRAADWWLAAHRSPEPAHDLALSRLALRPLLDLGIRAEDGTGALLAVPVLRAAAALR